MNGYNYDNWLNSNNPYDLADEEERERLDLIKFLKTSFRRALKRNSKSTLTLTDSKTHANTNADALFWEAEADIIRQELRDATRDLV